MKKLTITAQNGHGWEEEVDDDADIPAIIDDVVNEHNDILSICVDGEEVFHI